jgi:hypothetical protein
LRRSDTVRCNDILTLTKGDCELEANLVSTDCCGCENFNVFTYLTSISNTGFTLNSQLKQNTLNLSQLLIDNAFPAIGTLRYTITTSFVRLNTQMLPTGIIGTQVDYLNQSFNNIEFKSDNLIIQKPGNIFTVNGFTVQALSVTIEVQTQTNFHFPNQCIFTLPKTTIAVFTGSFNVVNKTTNLNSLTTCRLPLLTLFKGNHATAINTKIYAKYTNSFTRQHPDIEAYKYYKLVSDCSCIPDTFYSCTDGEANKLTFCLKNRPDIEFSNCNKKLKFVTPLIQDCIIMRNALYELVVNGVVVQTFNVQPDNTIIPMSYIYNSATTITLVEIRLVNDECEECIFTYTPPPSTITPTFEVETDICSDTNYQTFYIGANDSFQLFYHTTLEGTRTVVAVGNGITNSSVMANNGFYTLRILVDGCYAEITREITFNFIYPFADLVPLCNPTRLQITTTEPVNVFIPGISYSGSVNGTITVPAVDGTFTVISSIGTCTYIQEVTIECCNPNPISGVAVSYSCPNGVILSYNNRTNSYIYYSRRSFITRRYSYSWYLYNNS